MSQPINAASSSASGLVIKSDRSKLTLVDEDSMMKQIQATDAPKHAQQFNVRTLLNFVQDILTLATSLVADTTYLRAGQPDPQLEEKSRSLNRIPILKEMKSVVDRIAREISFTDLVRGNDDDTTLALFKMLSSYSWEAKLVLTMAAFALNYAESCLVAQAYSSGAFSKSMALLKKMRRPFLLELIETSKPRFDALINLIRVMMDVTNSVVDFKELPSIYISTEVPSFQDALNFIPKAVYRTIRSIVACGTWINNLPKIGHEPSTTTDEPWEMSKLRSTYEYLNEKLSFCREHIEEKIIDEAYIMLLNLYDKIHFDNTRILKAMFDFNKDVDPLFHGPTNKNVKIDVLRRKTVLLLISGLDISSDAVTILEQIYGESRIYGRMENLYEVVWIPVVDHTVAYSEEMHNQFETVQRAIPWYTVHHPAMIKKVVIRFMKEIWHFRMKPILVVLDPQGKVVCPNAFHMMLVWGSIAFPFTSLRQEALWKEETWRLDFLVNGIDSSILHWMDEGKYIFLYGGDDIEWIRMFTSTAKSVAQAERIQLEMVYVGVGVGNSTKRAKVEQVISAITVERLSYVWHDMTMTWFFWTRLESMFLSKIQLGKNHHDDPLMQEIKKLLSYDKEGGGWALLGRGSNVVANGHSTTVLQTLLDHHIWKQDVTVKGFDISFKEYHDKLHQTYHHCCQFDFPTTSSATTPHRFICPHCARAMDKFITFSCCDHETP
ncbi:protein SIEVE ELEMENT OCCLUSION B-like [Euphorbia lathyris]|uniref:protein SIEVE ELEMENT OCCLUSION B-like n=1 Tax=Euphorbia lathyris TaxID=212925 RepID=UPI0033138ADF